MELIPATDKMLKMLETILAVSMWTWNVVRRGLQRGCEKINGNITVLLGFPTGSSAVYRRLLQS